MNDSIGRRLKAARVKKGLSQAELAERIGVSQAAIGQWERGQYAPRGKNLNALNEVLGPDLVLEESQDWSPPVSPPLELSPSEFRAGRSRTTNQQRDPGHSVPDFSTRIRDHRFRSKEFQREVERLLIQHSVNVRSGIVLHGPNSRRWIIDLSTDHCVIEFTHPISATLLGRDLESLLWRIVVLRQALGHDERYVLLIREPRSDHVNQEASQSHDDYFEQTVTKVIEDAESVGIDVFVVRTPEQAAQILVELDQEAAGRS